MMTNAFACAEARAWPEEAHPDHELLWSSSGVVSLEAAGRLWMAPPSVGVFIPAGTAHVVRAARGTRLCATFFAPSTLGPCWPTVTAVSMVPALRELLLHECEHLLDDAARDRLWSVIADLLRPLGAVPVELPLPSDPALRRVADAILADPADRRSTSDWAAELAMSARQLHRLFARETGYSLSRWRIVARVRTALVWLADGQGVTHVAAGLGYANPSTFIEQFRRVTGQTPGAFRIAAPDAVVLDTAPDLVAAMSGNRYERSVER